MTRIVTWPYCLLSPRQYAVNLTPFTRSGGRSLGGVEPVTRTDLGYWRIDYRDIHMSVKNREKWQWWSAIRSTLSGRAGLVIVRAPSGLIAPFASDGFEGEILTPHSDGSSFSDGSLYSQSPVSLQVEADAEIGATVLRVRLLEGKPSLFGIRFSYQHALYETGFGDDPSGAVWDLQISPSLVAPIAAGEILNTTQPTCLCHLAEDNGMDIDVNRVEKFMSASVSFVQATDYWNALAVGGLSYA